MDYIKVDYCVTTEFDEGKIIEFLDDSNNFDEEAEEPTDSEGLDNEAENVTENFINHYLVGDENEADGSTWVNKEESKKITGFNKLKEKIKHYIYLKRHDSDKYDELSDEAY